MDFDFSPEEEEFRARVQSFLDANLPSEFDSRDPEFLKQWNQALGEAGWLGFAWPKAAGGGGATIVEQFILKEEMSARRAPPLGSDFMGLTWVGPAIIEPGSDEQKQQFLPELLAGESIWGTGYSEPGSGSAPPVPMRLPRMNPALRPARPMYIDAGNALIAVPTITNAVGSVAKAFSAAKV